SLEFLMRRFSILIPLLAGIVSASLHAQAQTAGFQLKLDRYGETIVLEPYAPNILRVTISLNAKSALGAPGYGFAAAPSSAGWTASQTPQADVYRSARIVASVDKDLPPSHSPLQSQVDIGKYFSGSAPNAHITLRTPAGKNLLEMSGWSQSVPNQKDGTAELARDRRRTDPASYVVGA